MKKLKSCEIRIVQGIHLVSKSFWYFSVKRNIRLCFFHLLKKSKQPSRMLARLAETPLHKFFYIFNIAFFAQSKRNKNTLSKGSNSLAYQKPHFVIGHTSVWRTFPKITMEEIA